MTAQIVACQTCGATGERYNYGWTGSDCWRCDGWGSYLVIDGKEYAFPANVHGLVYRDDKGRFAKVPAEALQEEEKTAPGCAIRERKGGAAMSHTGSRFSRKGDYDR